MTRLNIHKDNEADLIELTGNPVWNILVKYLMEFKQKVLKEVYLSDDITYNNRCIGIMQFIDELLDLRNKLNDRRL